MANKTTFSVDTRSTFGKAVKTLRKQRLTPGNISIPNEPSVAIAVSSPAFMKLYDQVGDTGLVYLQLANEKTERPVLVSEVQVNPVTKELVHVVFKQVNLKEKITAEVPIEIVGESSVPNTVIVTVKDYVEVEALPANLPEKFTVDVANLTEIGQMVTFADLQYDKSQVELLITEEEMSSPVIILQEVKEEAQAPAEEAAAEAPADAAGDATPTPAAE